MIRVKINPKGRSPKVTPGFPKFAGHAGHVQGILKMSGEVLLDRRTKCPGSEKRLTEVPMLAGHS